MKPKQGLIKQAEKVLKRASPTILSCLGVFGVIATSILAIKATPKALERIDDAQNAKSSETDNKLTRMETVGACWKCYAPAAITGVTTIGCILGANVLNRRQQASLVSAYAIINKTYQDYRHSVKNVFGEEGHKRVLEDMAVEKVSENHTIYTQGTFQYSTLDFCVSEEEHLFYDIYSDRQFTSTIGKVLQAEYHLNRMFAINGEASLNEFYNYLGIATVPGGDDIMWVVDPEKEIYWIDFNHDVTYMDDGLERPQVECLVIDFVTIP
ncbi:DUF6353 family protein [Oscillospiraceae bacterium 21-37]